MDTPTNTHLTVVDEQPPTTRRKRLVAWLLNLDRPAWLRVPGWARDPGKWITAGVAAVVIGVAAAVLAGIIWLIATIVGAIGDALSAAGDGIGNGASAVGGWIAAAGRWVTHGPITHSISDPVRAWLDAHTVGLPATGGQLWTLWLVAICALFVAAFTGSTYGRIGWALIGALTAYAVWHGTATTGTRPVAVGVTAAVWLVLSLLTYTRRRRMTWSAIEQRMARDRVLHRPEPAAETA